MMVRVSLAFAIVLLVFLATLATRTFLYGKELNNYTPVTGINIDQQESAQRLGGALAIRTVSQIDEPVASGAFIAMHRYLEITFPLIHENLERERVNEYSLLYTWQGKYPELKAKTHAIEKRDIMAD